MLCHCHFLYTSSSKERLQKVLYLSLFDRKQRRQAGQPVFSGQSVGESKKRARKGEKDKFVGLPVSLHTWLMTERSKPHQSPDSRNGEHRGGRKEGREESEKATLSPHTLRCWGRAMMKWWQKQNERKTNGVILWLRFVMYLLIKKILLGVCKVT